MVDIKDTEEMCGLLDSFRVICELKKIYEMGFEHTTDIIVNTSEYYNGYGYLDTNNYIESALGTLIGTGYASQIEDKLLMLNEKGIAEGMDSKKVKEELDEIEYSGYDLELKINNYMTKAMSKLSKGKINEIIEAFQSEIECYFDEALEYFDLIRVQYIEDEYLYIRALGPIYDPESLVFDIIKCFLDIHKEIKPCQEN